MLLWCCSGFAPELFGRPLDDGDVFEQRVVDKQGIPYYEWWGLLPEAKPALLTGVVRLAALAHLLQHCLSSAHSPGRAGADQS